MGCDTKRCACRRAQRCARACSSLRSRSRQISCSRPATPTPAGAPGVDERDQEPARGGHDAIALRVETEAGSVRAPCSSFATRPGISRRKFCRYRCQRADAGAVSFTRSSILLETRMARDGKPHPDNLMTTGEAARVHGLSPDMVRVLEREGRFASATNDERLAPVPAWRRGRACGQEGLGGSESRVETRPWLAQPSAPRGS